MFGDEGSRDGEDVGSMEDVEEQPTRPLVRSGENSLLLSP
jgi:hypothetical protein